METLSDTPEATATPTTAKPELPPPKGFASRLKGMMKHRALWWIGGGLALTLGVLGSISMFGKAKVQYATVPVQRGDVESTVVAAGIVQPF